MLSRYLILKQMYVAIKVVELITNLANGILSEDKSSEESKDNHMLSLFARAFSSDHLETNKGELKSSLTDIKVSINGFIKKRIYGKIISKL